MSTGADNIRGQLRVDEFLTNYATKYIPDNSTYIADEASTAIPTRNASGYYAVFDRSYWLRDELQPRPLGGPVPLGHAPKRNVGNGGGIGSRAARVPHIRRDGRRPRARTMRERRKGNDRADIIIQVSHD